MRNDTQNLEYVCKNLIAGGMAGMVSKTTVAPLDRIKLFLQTQSKPYLNHGVVSGLRHIIRTESVWSMYKGNGAQMIRIFPYAATKFTSFEIYKNILNRMCGSKTHIDKFIAGASAGVTAVTFTYPLDMIRSRLAVQISGAHIYTGIVNTAVTIFKKEGGTRGLYRGFTPTLVGMVPYAGLSFYCFENLKSFCMKYLPAVTCSSCQNTDRLVLNLPAKLICGGIAGAGAQSVSYPLDVTRKRMQLANMSPQTQRFGKSMLRTLFLIYQENGISKGLYRGLSINYIRAIPMSAMAFATYEICKQVLDLDTGLKA